jgi:hypothetical protein
MIIWLVATIVILVCMMIGATLLSALTGHRHHVFDQDLLDDASIRRFLDEEDRC